jgi:hypothetical protein
VMFVTKREIRVEKFPPCSTVNQTRFRFPAGGLDRTEWRDRMRRNSSNLEARHAFGRGEITLPASLSRHVSARARMPGADGVRRMAPATPSEIWNPLPPGETTRPHGRRIVALEPDGLFPHPALRANFSRREKGKGGGQGPQVHGKGRVRVAAPDFPARPSQARSRLAFGPLAARSPRREGFGATPLPSTPGLGHRSAP